ncbi:hypothetical protein [Sphingosinicella sp. BN140058]|uniref:hypothetical protein n=1 Tax=Sphingosinicella sp. BN140058 TaxID=1892855 RepID=UPI0013ED43C1|nr:hypothetical protein [Sphingosinicella sp. BN140058]
MCNRFRMTAKQEELALAFGIDPELTMPELTPLRPPEMLPDRLGWMMLGGAFP